MKRLLLSLPLLLWASIAAAQDMTTAIQSACSSNGCVVSNLVRDPIPNTNSIVHYSAILRVGPGVHDVIGIHRVVKETSPWKAKTLAKSIFLIHGDTIGFLPSFLIGTDVNGSAASSFSVFLAAHDIDVWGIDQRYIQIPADTTNFNFAASWDMNTQIQDTRIAMFVARGVRLVTGSGFGKLTILGWSRGGQTSYVLAQAETQVNNAGRSVGSMAILDVPLETNDPYLTSVACSITSQIETKMATGVYVDPIGSTVRLAGNLAVTDPNGPSPILPPLTNYQAAITFGGATYLFGLPYVPHYHLVGTDFSTYTLLYTNPTPFIQAMRNAAPFETLGLMRDGDKTTCTDTSFDDHLANVVIPVMYIGAEGGFGSTGHYTTTLLGSYPDNVEVIDISVDADPFFDFGHDDVIRSPQAQTRWWNRFLNWAKTH